MHKYPLEKLRKKEITTDDIIFCYPVTKKGMTTTYDRKEELKSAGYYACNEMGVWVRPKQSDCRDC